MVSNELTGCGLDVVIVVKHLKYSKQVLLHLLTAPGNAQLNL